jgi:SEC-C motif domain protein
MDLRGMSQRPCPCGATSYDEHCGRLHRGERQAGSPEELMRSRFSAYAVGDSDYVWRTWHPRTRPEQVTPDPGTQWTGLEIVEAVDDVVEFRAHFDGPVGPGVLHERSRFEQRAGRWFYVEGSQIT